MILSPARRVHSLDELQLPGDYWLTTIDDHGKDVPEVFFLLPIHTGFDMYDHSREGCGIHGVTQPPWTFRECPDGSLEIQPSIGCGGQLYYWHGYLDEGNVWRQL